MPKFGCQCGHVISLIECPNPNEAVFTSDQNLDLLESECDRLVAAFVSAAQQNREQQWLRRHFGEQYPADLDCASVLSDIRSRAERGRVLAAVECPSCGSIYLQRSSGDNEYVRYTPESGKYNGIFAGGA